MAAKNFVILHDATVKGVTADLVKTRVKVMLECPYNEDTQDVQEFLKKMATLETPTNVTISSQQLALDLDE